MIKKYKKKQIIIEAMQFIYKTENMKLLKDFCGDCLGNIKKTRHPSAIAEAEIKTLEDGKELKVKHIATEKDWIIKGINGEFYPCKPDIFEKTYEVI